MINYDYYNKISMLRVYMAVAFAHNDYLSGNWLQYAAHDAVFVRHCRRIESNP